MLNAADPHAQLVQVKHAESARLDLNWSVVDVFLIFLVTPPVNSAHPEQNETIMVHVSPVPQTARLA